MTGTLERRDRCVRLLALAAAGARAQFTQSVFRAADGTAYRVVREVGTLAAGAESQQVATIIGSASGSVSEGQWVGDRPIPWIVSTLVASRRRKSLCA